MYVDRLKSGLIIAYLKLQKNRLDLWEIEVKRFNRKTWERNISLPMFRDKESAEKWLANNYEAIREEWDE